MDVPWKMVEQDEKSPRSHGESPKSQVQFPQQSPTSISAAEWWSNRDTWQWRVCCGLHIFHMLYFMYGHTEMYFMICYMLYPCIYVLPNMLCMRIYIYILYHNMSYICIYVIQHIHGYIWIYPCMACVDVDDIIIQVQNAWNYVPELKNASVSTVFTWMHIQSGQRYAWCIVSTQ